MEKIHIDLENCYGIKKLQAEFDFACCRAFAVYAPNGSMKSSFARTFKDVSEGKDSKDRIFPGRTSKRVIKDENGSDIAPDSVFVIHPYEDEDISHTEKTSTLLVDSRLRREYEELHLEIDADKEKFLEEIKELSGSKKDIEKEISSTFTSTDKEFYVALTRINEELIAQQDAPFANVPYDRVFDEKVLDFLGSSDVKSAIESYIKKYNELLEASTYFKKGVFNYYNAEQIAKTLAANGFFKAKHSVKLNADENIEINDEKDLKKLIEEEKNKITSDNDLRRKFNSLERLMNRNASVRGFKNYLEEHEEILPELANIDNFREKIWKSYLKTKFDLYQALVDKYRAVETRKREIENEARQQRTQWEKVIEIFNSRFFVPFKLTAKNKVSVILGQEPLLSLSFTFEDGTDEAPVEKSTLMQVLSTGEKRALYVLNIIFEVEARRKANQETIFVIDDIADSFDYKNKYAIIQYLKDISDETFFKQIILTHNFDFFRTVNSRFVRYPSCLMALKTDTKILLEQATGIRNVFVKDWKPNFYTDDKKKIASIPFIRNLIEYTSGENDPRFARLTSLLHWKADSMNIKVSDLDVIYNQVFNENGGSSGVDQPVIALIKSKANDCLADGSGINFENKIVLSIAIRLIAEEFMITKINDLGSIK